jgi:hypothetical protein
LLRGSGLRSLGPTSLDLKGSRSGAAANPASTVPEPKQPTSKNFLYRRLAPAATAILVLLILLPPYSAAQGRPELKRPEEAPVEKPPEPKPKKNVKGPRALALLRFMDKGKPTLIPIAILVDGKFYDASAYKADPVPMALEGGTVYEAEQSGASQGLFTINGALHSKNPNASPWVGVGAYVLNGAATAKTAHKAEDVPRGFDSNDKDAPPRLTRSSDSKTAPTGSPAASPSGTPTSTSTSSGTSSSSTSPSSTPPSSTTSASTPAGKSSGGSAGSAPAAQPTSSSTAGNSSAPQQAQNEAKNEAPKEAGKDTQKPAASPAAAAKPADASANAQAPAQSDNYYRPTLRRGKPAESAPPEEEEAEAQSKPPTAGSPAANATGASTATVKPEPVRLVPAISDAGGPDPRPYVFFWKPGEEGDRLKQMLDLAGDELRAYVNMRAKSVISAAPASKTAATPRKAKVKPPQAEFENVQFRAFDVWVNNQPVMVLTAEGHLSPPPTVAPGPIPDSYSIALVARTDIYGNLRKLYSGVTDKYHLDVTPRLELIDAVDVDGDGRGELLFRETTDAGSGYIIYRATPDKLMKMFDSLES